MEFSKNYEFLDVFLQRIRVAGVPSSGPRDNGLETRDSRTNTQRPRGLELQVARNRVFEKNPVGEASPGRFALSVLKRTVERPTAREAPVLGNGEPREPGIGRVRTVELSTLRLLGSGTDGTSSEDPSRAPRVAGRPELVLVLRAGREPVRAPAGGVAGAEGMAAELLAARERIEASHAVPAWASSAATAPVSRDFARLVPPAGAGLLANARHDSPTWSERPAPAPASPSAWGTTARVSAELAAPSQAALQSITDQVVRVLDDRIAAHRERFGRI
jgi:hypothetical protein